MSERERISTILSGPVPEEAGRPCTVSGWVRSRRDSKAGLSFIDLSDGSSLTGLQVVAPGELPDYESLVLQLHLGCAITVHGLLIPSQGRGQAVELRAERIELVGNVDPEAYPIQKKDTSLEFLRGIPHLRARTRTFQAIMRLRSILAQAVHRFFGDRGFTYVHTPIITGSDCEGAGAQFRVAAEQDGKIATDEFFGQASYLTVSGQLEGETYACALGDIYTFGPTFRAENSHTTRHLSEFWMIEPEMAFCDLDGDRALAEDFVKAVVGMALAEGGPEIDFLEKQQHRGLRKELERLCESEFKHVTYDDAIERLIKSGKKFEYPVAWGNDLQAEHEQFLVEQTFKKPVVVTDWPKDIKAFYMRLSDDERTVAAMDVLVPRMGELIGGAQREERLDVLEARMVACGLDPAEYQHYLDLRRFGSVPHAGFGLGFERLVCLVTGTANIRDVMPYPRAPGLLP
jgi:asparaginyl-tRNA synthetase